MTLHECINCLEMIEEEDYDFDEKLCKDCKEPPCECCHTPDYKDDAD